MEKLESIQEVYDAELQLIITQSSLLLQKKKDGFNGELKTAGTLVEDYIKGIIKKHIPAGYSVCSGYIATADTISNPDNLFQHDIIIVDDRIPALYDFGVSDIKVVMAESVCGIIEVKRTLNKKTLVKAAEHLCKTKNILAKYNGGRKSKNAPATAVTPTLGVGTHAPLYAIVSLASKMTKNSSKDLKEIIEKYSYIDMIWSLSDSLLVQFQIEQGEVKYLPHNVSRKLADGDKVNHRIILGQPEDKGRIFRYAISILRRWINSTSCCSVAPQINSKYFGF